MSPPLDIQLTIKPPPDPPRQPEVEHIAELSLKECVGGGKTANTSISALGGVIRVEREHDGKKDDQDEQDDQGNKDDKDGKPGNYRIVASFQLQVKIHGFEKGYFKTHNRLFDFVSLRYLYTKDERHEILPNFQEESLATEAEVTEESTKSSKWDMGLSKPAASPAVAPTLSVQVGRDRKLTVKRAMKAWKGGLSYESWHPRRSTKLDHVGEYHGEPKTQRKDRYQKKHKTFQVQTQHRKSSTGCCCDNPFDFENCEFRDAHKFYDRCAHWFWQVSARPHFWTPEIYESTTFPVTVTRIIEPEKMVFLKQGQQHFHFDFVLKTRLRELGWLARDRFPSFRPTKPAEVRSQDDYGYPLGIEKIKFCVRACPEGFEYWPHHPTQILQLEAEEKLAS